MRKTIALIALTLLLACSQGGQTQEVAGTGDTVKVNYIGKFQNGTVFDTNIESVAQNNDISKNSYQPISLMIGEGKVVQGFENAIKGMQPGQTKTVTLSPDQAYGTEDQSKVITLNRTRSVNRTRELTRQVSATEQQLQQLGGNTSVGSIVTRGDVSYTIVRKQNGTAILRVDVEEGDVIQMPDTGWNATVVSVTDESYVVRQDPEDGQEVNSPFGPVTIDVQEDRLVRTLNVEEGGTISSQQGTGRITNVNASKVTVDFNHPFAGKNLTFEIELLDILS